MAHFDVDDVGSLGNILGVWAHPDDETFSTAGLMCLAAKNNQEVTCVTATKGEAGVQDAKRWPPEELAEIRAAELTEALRLIGATRHHWLGYPDGGCKAVDEQEAVSKIIENIERYRPDTIITFPPDGITGHDDHRAVSKWTRLALEKSGHKANLYYAVDTKEQYEAYLKAADKKFNIFFNVDEPVVVPEADCDILLSLTDDALTCKLAALEAMPSQTAAMFADPDIDWLHKSLAQESFIRADRDIRWN